MSGQPDSSDDLIAELAKLMATNAKGEATTTTSAPAAQKPGAASDKPAVRIPGMDMPPLTVTPIGASATPGAPKPPLTLKPRPSGAAPLRIPGMEPPPVAPLSQAPRAEPKAVPGPQSQAPRPVTPQATPIGLQPLPPRPPIPTAAPSAATPTAQSPANPPAPAASGSAPQTASGPAVRIPPAPTRFEPRIVGDTRPLTAAPASPAAPAPSAPVPQAVPVPTQPAAAQPAPPQAKPAGTPAPQSGAGGQGGDKPAPHDPIADIIAAELDAAPPAPARDETPIEQRPVPVPVIPAAQRPAQPGQRPVQVVPPPGQPAAPRPAPAAPAAAKPAGLNVKQVPHESDAFFVAPSLGVTGKQEIPAAPQAKSPPPPAAPASSDPMDEIESLIGEAVRVEIGGEQPQAKRQRPNVNPVVPQLQPRRATIKQHDTETQPQSAEAAILAAAAATGAEVGRVEPVAGTEPAGRRKQFRPARSRGMSSGVRQYVGLAVAGTLLLAAGLGLYWVVGMGRPSPADAPVLTADATPVKQAPLPMQASVEASSPVLDQIDGKTTPPEQEALVAAPQTDTDAVNSVVADEGGESGLANRKVRTVTVRPDGTIVASDNSTAGAEPLPVERPNVPTVPGANVGPSELLTAAVDPPAATPTTTTAPSATTTPAATTSTPAPDPITAAITNNTDPQPSQVALAPMALAAGATPTPSDVVAPTPRPRPSSRANLNGQPSASVTAEVTQPRPTLDTALTANGQSIDLLAQPSPAASQPAPAATQVATTSSSSAAAYVQLSSQRSEADARASAQNMQARYGSLFSGIKLEIQRADLGARGIYYRVMLPANSRSQAADLCGRVKSAGGDCFIP